MIDLVSPALVIALLIALNAVFTAAEFALLAASRPRIERLATAGGRAARLVHWVHEDQRRQDSYVATAQLGITFASVGLGMYGEHAIAGALAPVFAGLGVFQEAATHSAAGVGALLILTYFHVVLGEMVPKTVTLANPDRTAMVVVYPMLWAKFAMWPLVALLNGVGYLLLRLLRVPLGGTSHPHSPQELEMIVEESEEKGVLSEQESEIIVNLLHFSDVQVRKVMVPRTHVVGIPSQMSAREASAVVEESRHTRYPVYEESLDQIVGILHVKGLFRELRHHPEDAQITRALRDAVFIPEQATLEDLLIEFRRQESQMAVVIDEYGGTSGIVSLEDVLEEIFGEVQDEFDEEEPLMEILESGRIRVRGQVRLDEFCDEFDLNLERPDVDTVGGLVLAELGRPPAEGDEVRVEGVLFTVTRADGLAVGEVEAELLGEEVDSETE